MKLRLRLRQGGGGGAPGVLVIVQEPGDVIRAVVEKRRREMCQSNTNAEGGAVAAVRGYPDRRTGGEQARTSVESEPSTEGRGGRRRGLTRVAPATG
jgi:hypothetical protein